MSAKTPVITAFDEACEKKLFKCRFCGKEWVTLKRTHTLHERTCHMNPHRIPNKSRPRTEEEKQNLREKALKRPPPKTRRMLINYKDMTFDSSWEVAFAQRLDVIGVRYIRNDDYCLPYVDENGVERRYVPDFILVEWGLFVEIKNPYLFQYDPKVEILQRMYDNIIWLNSLDAIYNFSVSDIEAFCRARGFNANSK